jgi:putative pyruvate formate lyase activating enzyme
VSSAFAHFGEEDCLRGVRGSGTIFFGGCNLHCAFCQNADISWFPSGAEIEAGDLSAGCHNINLVTPSHVVPQVIEAVAIAAGRGLRLPIVYNTSGYDTVETLRRLDGVVDVYMPDFTSTGDPRRHNGTRTPRTTPRWPAVRSPRCTARSVRCASAGTASPDGASWFGTS